jgi:murein DD-endopeptidase MepM/ murein hydrolase activator NlpD
MLKKFQCIPLDKIFITQCFGENREMYKKYGLAGHNGLDFRTKFQDSPLGRREIYAVDPGEVEKVVIAKTGGYGTYIKLRHCDGSKTIYGHQFSVKVIKGQKVIAGQVIGISDNTGDSTGPHLHLGYMPPNPDKNNGFKGYEDPYALMPLPPYEDFVGCGS